MTNFKKFNEVKKIVKNNNLSLKDYQVNYITKLIYVDFELNESAEKRIANLISKFWDAHQSSKKRSNDKKIRDANRLKKMYAQSLVEIIEKENAIEVFNKKAGKFASFILNTAEAQFVELNRFGKLSSNLKYA